jgi:hypothetical protein
MKTKTTELIEKTLREEVDINQNNTNSTESDLVVVLREGKFLQIYSKLDNQTYKVINLKNRPHFLDEEDDPDWKAYEELTYKDNNYKEVEEI